MAECTCGCGCETPLAEKGSRWHKVGEPLLRIPGHDGHYKTPERKLQGVVNSRAYRDRHPELMKERKKRWIKTSAGRLLLRRARKKYKIMRTLADKKSRKRLKLECLCAYSSGDPKCSCCGESELVFLTLDHPGGGGSQQRKIEGHRGGQAQYRRLRQQKYPPGYRVLCWNCNLAIAFLGVCPHQKMETIKRELAEAEKELELLRAQQALTSTKI